MKEDSNPLPFFASCLSYGQTVWIASVALLYFLTARLSLSLVFQPEGIAAIWPPSGIFLSAILLSRRSARPYLVSALLVMDFIAELLAGTPLIVSAIYALELSADAVLSSWLLLRFVGDPITFRKVRDVFGFLILAVILSNGLLSLVAAAASVLIPGTSFWNSWKEWATSTGIGNLLITPIIISWASWVKTGLGTWNPKRAFEIVVLFILVALVNFISFSYRSTSDMFSLFLPYLTFPFLLWAALRFELRGVTSVLVIMAAIAISFVAMGRVPDFHESPLGAVLVLQFYLTIMAVPSLFLAAVITDRKQTEEALRESERRYHDLFDQANEGLFMMTPDGQVSEVNEAFAKMHGYTVDELKQKDIRELDELKERTLEERADIVRHIQAGEVVRFEVEHYHKKGHIFPLSVTSSMIDIGSQTYYLAFHQDITERKRAEEEITLLADIGQVIGSTLEIDEVYDRVAGEIRKMIPFDSMIVILSCAQQETLNVAYVSGLDIPGRRVGDSYSMQGTVWEEIIRTRRGVIVQSENPEDIVDKFPSLVVSVRAGMRSVMSIPLISRDEVIGSLHFRAVKPNSYTDEMFRLAERIGMQIAGAIANAQMVNDLKQAESTLKRKEAESRLLARENEILAKIGRIISSNINIQEVYGRFAEEASKVISFDRLSVNIINRAEGMVTVAYTAGLPIPGRQPGDVFSLACSTNELVAAKRSGLLIQPKTEEMIGRLLSEQQPSFKAGLRSQMAVPLLSEDQVIGILSFLSKQQNAYTDADLKLGEEIGIQIAGAIAGALLYNSRLRVEEALKKSEERFRELANSLPQVVFEMDSRGVLTYVNSNAFDLFGYNKEDFEKGLSAVGMLIQEDRERVGKNINKLMQGETLGGIEYTAQKMNGETFPVVIHSKRVLRDGKPIGVRGILFDITEQKKAQEEKAKLQDQLLQSQRIEAIGQLAGGVAHDFNNMLAVILGHAEIAIGQVDPAQTLHTHLQEIRKAAEHSSDITRQLLAFARKQVISPKVLDINETVEGILKMLRRLIGEDINLAWLPGIETWPVKVDPSQIDQILANLCVNARDAIAGVGKLTIETGNVSFDGNYCADHIGFVPGEYVLLAVSDSGCGMDKETIDKIFEPFFTTKNVGKGTGLGLATVYGIVKQNNGFINVYSEPSHGTTFKIYLPRHIGKVEQAEKQELREPVMRGGETVLVVEDEPALLELSKLILEKQGYRVLTAGSPNEAIQLAGEHTGEIQLLLTDVVMPEMNGRDLAKYLLALNPHLKCLFTSGYTANVIAHHGVLDEGVYFLQKPFSRKDLAAKVREALDQK